MDNYNAKFQFFEKIKVNGSDAHPLYQFLKSEKAGGLGISTIKWNFAKFLVDVDGNVVYRAGPQTNPLSLEPKIIELLKAVPKAESAQTTGGAESVKEVPKPDETKPVSGEPTEKPASNQE